MRVALVPALLFVGLLFVGLGLPRPAPAGVVSAAPGGFVVRVEHTVTATPMEAWAGLLDIGSWWRHAFSGDASNFRLDAAPGGAWIEELPDGGFVEHMRVVFARPGERLALYGALGPLTDEACVGNLVVALAAVEGGTRVTLTYGVAGYRDGGFESFAAPVDGVLSEAAARLARRIDTGSAD